MGRLNWAVQSSRPDAAAFDMVELSMKFKNGRVGDLQRAVKVLRKPKQDPARVFFSCLGDPEAWKLMVFSDAALTSLWDGVSSMGAHVLFLVGQNGSCCPLSWQANNTKGVVKSTIAAEALTLQEGIDDDIYLRTILTNLLGISHLSLPLEAYVDNRSVVESIHSTKLVDDKRLRLEVGALKESFATGEVSMVRWCLGAAQLASCITKKGAPGN